MDMSDYKNKRGIPSASDIANIAPSLANAKGPLPSLGGSKFPPPAQSKFPPPSSTQQKAAASAVADEAWELDDDDESDDGWGKDNFADLKKFDYKNTDLNKMSDF